MIKFPIVDLSVSEKDLIDEAVERFKGSVASQGYCVPLNHYQIDMKHGELTISALVVKDPHYSSDKE